MGWRRRLALLGSLCLVASLAAPVARAGEPVPVVMFASDAAGTYDLYSIRVDGSGLRRVTSGPEADTSPSWSPDGRHVAFWTTSAGTSQLAVIRADGRGRRTLRVNARLDGQHHLFPPAWSPTGEWILFESNRDAPATALTPTDLYVIRPDGSGLRRVTTDGVLSAAPGWAPDGRTFVYSRQPGDSSNPFPDLFVRDLAASTVTCLTHDAWHDWAARWSPDGTRLAFVSTRGRRDEPLTFRLHVRESSGAIRRVVPPGDDAMTIDPPAWTPDGRFLVYSRDPDGTITPSLGYFGGTDVRIIPPGPRPAALHVIRLDGRGRRALTDGTSNAITPAIHLPRR